MLTLNKRNIECRKGVKRPQQRCRCESALRRTSVKYSLHSAFATNLNLHRSFPDPPLHYERREGWKVSQLRYLLNPAFIKLHSLRNGGGHVVTCQNYLRTSRRLHGPETPHSQRLYLFGSRHYHLPVPYCIHLQLRSHSVPPDSYSEREKAFLCPYDGGHSTRKDHYGTSSF